MINIMKKEVIVLLLLGILLVSPLVSAQEQSQIYSGLNRFVDNIKLFFSSGDSKVILALDIREKEVNSAIVKVQNQGEDEAIKNLERAKEKLQIVQEKVSLKTSAEIKTNVDEVIARVNEGENLPEEFDEYILEEEKTQLTAVLTEKTYEYCSELTKEDFALMLKDEECNPETAPEPLKKDLEKLKDLQERMFVKLMLEIRSCIDDPGTCNCENNFDDEEKIKCEKRVSLALKCEYQNDEDACSELNSLDAPKTESFVPEFLMNLFRAKKEQMLWGETHSDCVPEECWNENDKPECKQYDKFKETEEDWDEYGNFIGTRNKCGKEGSTPTMKESIPQCFDGDVFLEEKCGEIAMVENEEGLINYIIEKEVENIIDKLENASIQNKIDVNGTEGQTVVNEIKQDMNQIKEQIAKRTFAPGTYDTGNSTNDVKNVVVEKGEGSGDDGLVTEVKTGGELRNDPLPQEDRNKINPDLYDPNADTTTNIIEGGTGENIIEGGDCGDGVDCGDGSADPGTEGTNDISPAVDSNEGDSDVTITGDVIASDGEESFLSRFFKRIFG